MSVSRQFPYPVSAFDWFEESGGDNASYFVTSSYCSSKDNWIDVSKWTGHANKVENCFSYELSFPPTHVSAESINGFSVVYSGIDVTVARIQQDLEGVANLYSFQIPANGDIIPVTSHRCCVGTAPKIYASALNGKVYLWDVESMKLEETFETTHGICYDIDYCITEPNIFASVGFNGTVLIHDRRDFARRNAEALSTGGNPTIRIQWNRLNTNYLAAMSLEDNAIIALDVRKPFHNSMYFKSHKSHINSFCWSPYSSNSMYSCDVSGECLYWSIIEGDEQTYQYSHCISQRNLRCLVPHPTKSVASVVVDNKVIICPIQIT